MKRMLSFLSVLSVCMGLSMEAHADGGGRKIKVACIGDSITYGTGIEDRDNDSYPSQLQRLLGDGYVVGNFGKPGATLLSKGHRPYVEQEEYRQALEFAGDIAIIHLGVNDTDPRNWPNYQDEFIGDYLRLIESFRQVNPGCKVYITRLTPIGSAHPRFESGTRDWEDEIQLAIEKIAAHNDVTLIDFHAPLYPFPNLFPDAIHPNPVGAGILAATVYSHLTGDFGGLKMPSVFTDNMVLQRDRPLKISGSANAGCKVEVTVFREGKRMRRLQQISAEAGHDGRWELELKALEAGGPYKLTVESGNECLEYGNVLAGEVWLCSGQSNMAFTLYEAATADRDIPLSANSEIRFFDMKQYWQTQNENWRESALDSVNRLIYYKDTRWEECTPETSGHFSAVAYYFGRKLQQELGVPVGLICNAVGGSATESWVDRSTLEHQFPAILRNWSSNDFVQQWVRERGSFNTALSKDRLQRHPYQPCYLFESGILPLEKFPLAGVIWYQGESNAHNYQAHEKLFGLLLESWRKNWDNPELPFGFVQLSSINRPSWPRFRDSQRRMLEQYPAVGMAVCSDLGHPSNVHPVRKQEVGERLAAWALNGPYGRLDVVPSGPLYRSAEFSNGKAVISFSYGEGLKADGEKLAGFELSGDDGLFHEAEARIEGDKVVLRSDKVPQPSAARYGWQPYTEANLVNGAGFPASTFLTD
ncbi:MAG: sialate O-acetylesterase [Bacteroidales bacterium]|nr:sialate O-acetylesterase [Bacteroidales bacterium]